MIESYQNSEEYTDSLFYKYYIDHDASRNDKYWNQKFNIVNLSRVKLDKMPIAEGENVPSNYY
jgi:hypothetical protein